MKRRVRIIFLCSSAILFAWLLFIGVRIWRFGGEDYAKKSDCVIVLGAAVYGDKPSPVFEERIKHALTLYRGEMASKIIFTGGRGESASHAESEVAAAYAAAMGVDEGAILIEEKSRTTHQNLEEAKRVMTAAGLKTAILVSDPLHMKRASMMADDLGMKAVSSPTSTSRYQTLRTKFGFLLREVYFHHHYWVTGD